MNNKISNKDIEILTLLRENARNTLTKISKKTSIPISTIFEKIKHSQKRFIKRFTALLNYRELGFNTEAIVFIKVNRDDRQKLERFLQIHSNINNVYKVNNGFDIMFEAIFSNINDLEEFIESLEKKFQIESTKVHYIIREIKKEGFSLQGALNINLIENK